MVLVDLRRLPLPRISDRSTESRLLGKTPLPSLKFDLLKLPHNLHSRPITKRQGKEPQSQIDTRRRNQRPTNTLTTLLATHGTLLFRSLPITSASDFSAFAHAFGFKPHEIIGITIDRPELALNVAPANEAPHTVRIYNRNESPQVPHAPEYVFFWSKKAPSSGGETPINSSLKLIHRAQKEIPEFIDALAEKGILTFGKEIVDGDDEATQRAKIEKQIARYGRGEYTTFEWRDGGETLVVSHRLPVIRTQPGTNLPTLFTGLAAYYNKKIESEKGSGAGRKNVADQLFGDGTPIPEVYLQTLAKITDEIRVLHRWEDGDVLVFDNVIAQHGREPWGGEQGDRVVLASLFDSVVPGGYGFGGWSWLGRRWIELCYFWKLA
ncbi:hypothetical protein BJX70DRAFT_397221 [Aspergillus crustosus]